MAKTFDRPITIQKCDEMTETWVDAFKLHACINKSKSDSEYLSAGAIQGKRSLVFEGRYFKDLVTIANNLQYYRIIYEGIPYDIQDYDDFMMMHKTVKLLGVSY